MTYRYRVTYFMIPETNTGFSFLGIKEPLLGALAKLKIETPTPIQKKSIPVALLGQDLIGVAQTGTGKTLAFGLPMIQKLIATGGRALVVLPTRELAAQVEESLRPFCRTFYLRTAVLIGGTPIARQIIELRHQPRIVLATPGRLMDHVKRKTLKFDNIKIVVLDEADMMFD